MAYEARIVEIVKKSSNQRSIRVWKKETWEGKEGKGKRKWTLTRVAKVRE